MLTTVSLRPCFALLLKPFHQPKSIFARLTMRRGRTHLDTAVVDPRGLALDAAGVTAASAALHLHTWGPDQEVGRCGVHLAPRYLVNDRPGLANCGNGFLCKGKNVKSKTKLGIYL